MSAIIDGASDKNVLKYITKLLTSRPGNKMFIIGPSGTGKTHLMNILVNNKINATDSDFYGEIVNKKWIVDYSAVEPFDVVLGISDNLADIYRVYQDKITILLLSIDILSYRAIALAKLRDITPKAPDTWVFEHLYHVIASKSAIIKSLTFKYNDIVKKLKIPLRTRLPIYKMEVVAKLKEVKSGWEGKKKKESDTLSSYYSNNEDNTIIKFKRNDVKQKEIFSFKQISADFNLFGKIKKVKIPALLKQIIDVFDNIFTGINSRTANWREYKFHFVGYYLNPETREVRAVYTFSVNGYEFIYVLKRFISDKSHTYVYSHKICIGDLNIIAADWNTKILNRENEEEFLEAETLATDPCMGLLPHLGWFTYSKSIFNGE